MDKETEKQALEAFEIKWKLEDPSHVPGRKVEAKFWWLAAWESRGRASGQQGVDDSQYRAFLDLMMCSDPWPVSDLGAGDGHGVLTDFADQQGRRRGYENWIVAYHEFKPLAASPQITTRGVEDAEAAFMEYADQRWSGTVNGKYLPSSLEIWLACYSWMKRSTKHQAIHASAPTGCICSDCQIDGEPCPDCYQAWWKQKHPNTIMVGERSTNAPVGVPEELMDLVRFLAATWSEVDKWAYLHCGEALMKYPVIQGTRNQIDLSKIGQQRFNTENIRKAVDWMLRSDSPSSSREPK